MSGELKTPEQWCAELGARIREEFDRRLRICTIDGRGYPDFIGRTP